MRYKLLGRSGLRVSELALGTMTFGPEWGWGASKDESRRMFDAYAEAGGNFLDTANRYTEGTSERYVGEFIASDRDHWVVATKDTLWMRRDDPNFSGNHRKNMVQALDASLKRLGTDYIDLYWVHAWDFTTPTSEVMRALDDMVRAGKVLHVGISDTPAWVVSRANTLAELRGWSPFVALQLRYSLIDRTAERDLIPMARAMDMAITPWSILGAGTLTGKYSRGATPTSTASLAAAGVLATTRTTSPGAGRSASRTTVRSASVSMAASTSTGGPGSGTRVRLSSRKLTWAWIVGSTAGPSVDPMGRSVRLGDQRRPS